jgi:hypothetical protein
MLAEVTVFCQQPDDDDDVVYVTNVSKVPDSTYAEEGKSEHSNVITAAEWTAINILEVEATARRS